MTEPTPPVADEPAVPLPPESEQEPTQEYAAPPLAMDLRVMQDDADLHTAFEP